MKFHRLFALGALAAACFCAQMEQHTNKENMVHDRGQTAVRRDSLQHGRPSPEFENAGPATLRGILVDGGCQNRANLNLLAPPETLTSEAPAQPADALANNPPASGAVSAKGITVDAATINAERADVMENQAPGTFERQTDPTCAITGSTSSFALLTDSGRFLDLDEGGNTLAMEAVESTSGGRAVLNGQGPGVKPRVTVTGFVRNGRKLVAQDVRAAG